LQVTRSISLILPNTVIALKLGAFAGAALNLFAAPDAAYASFRPTMISLDTTSNGGGQLRGRDRWNLDLIVAKRAVHRRSYGTQATSSISTRVASSGKVTPTAERAGAFFGKNCA